MMSKMIEITTKIGCKMNCRFCPQNLLCMSYYNNQLINTRLYDENNNPVSEMSLSTFKECVDKIPAEIDIHFSGMCEPWAASECTEMILYAKHKGHRIHVFTTLVGMTLNDFNTIKNIHFESFVLHIPDNEGNSHFPLNEEYYKLLNSVISEANNGSFKIDWLSCHGTVHSTIAPLLSENCYKINSKLFDRAGNITGEPELISSTYKEGAIICKWCNGAALDKNVLLPDGTVLLCCMDYGMKHVLGNLLFDTYEDIDEGEKKRKYRNMLLSEKRGDIICRKCHRSEKLVDE